MRRISLISLAFIIALTFIILAPSCLATSDNNVVIRIDNSGLATVEMKTSILPGLNNIMLPAKPIPETLRVVVNGEQVTPIYSNMSIIVPS